MKEVRVCDNGFFKVKQTQIFWNFCGPMRIIFLKIEVKQQIKFVKGRDPDLNISTSKNRHEKVLYDR